MSDSVQGSDPTKPYREMAERIALNESANFAGAFVITPPKGGSVVELLMLSGDIEEATFWSQLKVMAEIEISKIQDRQTHGWGRR